jgi:hypothetical protein
VYPPPGSNPYHSQGKNVYPPHGKNVYPPHGQINHSTYNVQNPPGYAHVSHAPPNPSYPGQQQPYVGGPTSYNYPPNPVYGPIGVLCRTSIIHTLTENYLSLRLWISQTCLS